MNSCSCSKLGYSEPLLIFENPLVQIVLMDFLLFWSIRFSQTRTEPLLCFLCFLVSPRTFNFENKSYKQSLEATTDNKYNDQNTNLLITSLLSIRDNSGNTMSDTIQKPTYDDFGHIIGNNRSGMVRDLAITDVR